MLTSKSTNRSKYRLRDEEIMLRGKIPIINGDQEEIFR